MNQKISSQQLKNHIIPNVLLHENLHEKIKTLQDKYGKPSAVKNLNEALNCTKQGCGSSGHDVSHIDSSI